MHYEHHATHVIMEIVHRCADAAKKGDADKAKSYSNLAATLEAEFPDAHAEIERLYPKS